MTTRIPRRLLSLPSPPVERGALLTLVAGIGLLAVGVAGFTSTLPYRAGLIERAPLSPAPAVAAWQDAQVFTEEQVTPSLVAAIDETPEATAAAALVLVPPANPVAPSPAVTTVEPPPAAAAAAEPVKPVPTATATPRPTPAPAITPTGVNATAEEPLPEPGTRGYLSPFAYPEDLHTAVPSEPEPPSAPATPIATDGPPVNVGHEQVISWTN